MSLILLEKALTVRKAFFDEHHEGAFRLFNGFFEGNRSLVVDLYARTLVFHQYDDPPELGASFIQEALAFYTERLPWVQAVLLKIRNSSVPEERRGKLIFGTKLDRRIIEHGVRYAVDLEMNRDASFYLDTRHLREWAIRSLRGKTVLNAFAYTGSLGVAAQAGGAAKVTHLDLNRHFLNVAKESYSLNGFSVKREDFIAGDFWSKISHFKNSKRRFDCVMIDPPFFSTTEKGTVDLNHQSARLINKVRPLVNDGGWIVAINNALFVSGQAYLETVESLCGDGYLKIVEQIPVSEDILGGKVAPQEGWVTDPAPFNHSTKIVILEVRRKSAD